MFLTNEELHIYFAKLVAGWGYWWTFSLILPSMASWEEQQ